MTSALPSYSSTTLTLLDLSSPNAASIWCDRLLRKRVAWLCGNENPFARKPKRSLNSSLSLSSSSGVYLTRRASSGSSDRSVQTRREKVIAVRSQFERSNACKKRGKNSLFSTCFHASVSSSVIDATWVYNHVYKMSSSTFPRCSNLMLKTKRFEKSS